MASSDIPHTPVALVYQSAALNAHMRQALADAGARVVYESATASFNRSDLEASGATVVVVNLDPDSDEDLDAIDELLVDDARKVIVNDGELTSKLSGWDQARWARHLVAKIFGGNELLPQRPPGAEEVPVRGMPQHGLDSSRMPSSMSAPVVSNAAEAAASHEITEAFSRFNVTDAVAGAAASARDDLEAALRDFGFLGDTGPADPVGAQAEPGAGAIPKTPEVAPAVAAAGPPDDPFGGLEIDQASGAVSASAAAPAGDSAGNNAAMPASTSQPFDDFDSLFSFDPEPAAATPVAEARPVVDPLATTTLDFDLDFPPSSSELPQDEGMPTAFDDSAAGQAESMFEFDFELDSPPDGGANESQPSDARDTEALVDFDLTFGRSDPAVSLDDGNLPASGALPAAESASPDRPGAGPSAGVTGERSIEQLLAGLDLQLTEFEPAESPQANDTGAQPTGTDRAESTTPPEPAAADRFASFSFELEAIEEAPTDLPERAVVEQILVDPQSGRSRVTAAVAAAAAAGRPLAASTQAPALAAFDNLFDEVDPAAGAPDAATGSLQRVWVLGASIGGPDAVREFLSGIPASTANLFLLAQHMGADFVDLMIGQLARASALPVSLAAAGEIASNGQVLVVPLAERMLLDRDGLVSIEALPTPSAYSPSIDQVLRDVADRFGAAAGAIIFSGMAHDAIEGAKYLASKGGVVWAQDPATCVVSSMIDGAVEAGIVKFVASPAELASRFVAEFP